MSEDVDDSQKTEEPTQKRLDDAREKGDVPRSAEIKHAAMIGSSAIVVTFIAGLASVKISDLMKSILEHAATVPIDGSTAHDWAVRIAGALAIILIPTFVIFFVAALGAGLIQGRPTFAWDKVAPKWSKVSPVSGFQRLFSSHSFVEFLKTLAKVVIVGVACVLMIAPYINRFEQSLFYPMVDTLALIRGLSVKLFLVVAAIVAALAVLDFMYQRQSFLKRMRMSRQELRDEYKQSDGDPMIKARIRQIRLERSRKRMMAAVPEADVVITNPTHFAVALKYDHGAMSAPKLVAKGVDSLALRIRAKAAEHAVPIVENPPLARTLYATVDVDDEIPPEHYKAVAEVISYVLRLKGKLLQRS
jgi:flagellar biosynthesis protein FlhB